MSIASAIANKQQEVADCYTAISNKGGTLPATQNVTNMPTAIASIPSGSTPTISSLSITPSTSAQTFNSSSVDGYKPVTVSAVTSSIDANITAGNIKSGVTILGVQGTYSGSTPTLITKSITQNGTYNASSDNADGYSSVTVNVSGGGIGIPREVKNGVYQMPTESFTFSLPSNATDVVSYGLYYAFYGCTGLTSLDLSSLTTVSGEYALCRAFYGCTALTSVDLSSLTTVSGEYALNYAFQNRTGLTSLDLSSLTTVSGRSGLSSAFSGCTGLTSVDLSSLTTVSGSIGLSSAFYGCTALTSVDLSSLTTVSGSNGLSNAFQSCKGLTDVYFRALTTTSFGSYKNQFNNMLSGTGTTTTHTLHFPSNLQSTISGLTGYPNFGGTSGYVTLSFDLPATS